MKDIHRVPHIDLEELVVVLGELRELARSQPIIVEGKKDVESLKGLGVLKNVIHLNQGNAIIDFCTFISHSFDKVIILTDWDSKGNDLCTNLKQNLKACDVSYNTHIRERLMVILRKEIKDVQGIHSYLARNHPDTLDQIYSEVRSEFMESTVDDVGENILVMPEFRGGSG